jgi:cystathionine beta-lyase
MADAFATTHRTGARMNADFFDQRIERRHTDSIKWQAVDSDVLPMWVADMDFRSPDAVVQALHERVAHGVFGYPAAAAELSEVICDRLERLYYWRVTPEQIVYLPGLVTGLSVVCRAMGAPGEGVVMQTPAYMPFLSAPGNQGLRAQTARLAAVIEGRTMRYELDDDAFEAAITPETRLFLMCHPHNPIGQEFAPSELSRLAHICLRHNLVICSDEIHGDLMLDEARHTPLAALAPEIAERAITLMAPSKTFNLAGLSCSFAIIQNPELRQRFSKAGEGLVPVLNVLGQTAALAAYRAGDEWLTELRRYLTANRNALLTFVAEQLPALRSTVPQATYLAWLDCRDAGLPSNPAEFFLKEARVALNDGPAFGPGGEGFVRLNFGCPRAQLMEALERMRAALERHAN